MPLPMLLPGARSKACSPVGPRSIDGAQRAASKYVKVLKGAKRWGDKVGAILETAAARTAVLKKAKIRKLRRPERSKKPMRP